MNPGSQWPRDAVPGKTGKQRRGEASDLVCSAVTGVLPAPCGRCCRLAIIELHEVRYYSSGYTEMRHLGVVGGLLLATSVWLGFWRCVYRDHTSEPPYATGCYAQVEWVRRAVHAPPDLVGP